MTDSTQAQQPSPNRNADSPQTEWHEHQFVAPFQILQLTAHDCRQHLSELSVSEKQVSSDAKALLAEVNAAHRPYIGHVQQDDWFLFLAGEAVSARARSEKVQGLNYWFLIACRMALQYFHYLQKEQNHRLTDSAVRLALFGQFMMNAAWKPKRLDDALVSMKQSLDLVSEVQSHNKELLPHAEKGKKFSAGKPKGAIGPVAKRIKAHLKLHPHSDASQVWDKLASKPGVNFVYCDNSLGRYIEAQKGGATIMKWGRFCNLVSEHRPK